MQPRHLTSTKWTRIPAELKAEILATLVSTYQKKFPQLQWHVEGQIYPEEICFRMGYSRPNQIKQSHFALSWNYKEGDPLLPLIHQAIDTLDALILESLEPVPTGKTTEWPRIWKALPQSPYFFCFLTENYDLEEQANAFLNLSSDALTQGDWDLNHSDPDLLDLSNDESDPQFPIH